MMRKDDADATWTLADFERPPDEIDGIDPQPTDDELRTDDTPSRPLVGRHRRARGHCGVSLERFGVPPDGDFLASTLRP